MKKRIFVVGGILIAAGAAGGLGWYYYQQQASPAADGELAYVSTVSKITGNEAGVINRYAGVVEPQETVEVKIDSGRVVKEVKVKAGEEVKKGQLLFEYDLSSIQENLQEEKLNLERLKNEALSLKEQIATLESEKKKASKDQQLSYTIEIETNKMNLKKNEYDQESKTAQIQKLQNATGNTEVRSEIDGVIQKIDASKMTSEDGEYMDESAGGDMYGTENGDSGAFITILSTGAYRIKGKINELNEIMEGHPIIIRSRADETKTWSGVVGSIDYDNAAEDNTENNMMYYGMMDSSDSQTTSTSYPFYVTLDSSEGLMLGQHVYIEPDNGQEEKKDGLWLSDFYIADVDSPDPYVWAVDKKNRLEKRPVILGKYDELLGEYEIVDGLGLKDSIAFPAENLVEGMGTTTSEVTMEESMDNEMGVDMETNSEDPEIIEDSATEELVDDFSDEELVPVEEAP